MDGWTDDEVQNLIKWGPCEFCDGPRTSKIMRTGDMTSWLLVCLWCGKQAT